MVSVEHFRLWRCWRAPLRRSQPAGHSSSVINVYWHNTDTLRSRFLVCEWKMLLECHTKWGVGAFPPCTSFPSVFRGLSVYYGGCRVLRLVFISLFDTVCLFFPSQHLTVLSRIFPFEIVRLEMLWYFRLCCFWGINRIMSLYWNTEFVSSVRWTRPKFRLLLMNLFEKNSYLFFKPGRFRNTIQLVSNPKPWPLCFSHNVVLLSLIFTLVFFPRRYSALRWIPSFPRSCNRLYHLSDSLLCFVYLISCLRSSRHVVSCFIMFLKWILLLCFTTFASGGRPDSGTVPHSRPGLCCRVRVSLLLFFDWPVKWLIGPKWERNQVSLH